MSKKTIVIRTRIPKFVERNAHVQKRRAAAFEIEITNRCNNNCRHCYINRPANDMEEKIKEMSLEKISYIADQAVALGSLWCLVTGGEPLLRDDFPIIYLLLKKKGFLISVYTNACLITEEHIALFKKFPPRILEVTVYGVSRATYEKVTCKPGSYNAFQHGLDLLIKNKIKVRLKAMALRSNFHEFSDIANFCRQHTHDYFRFDPFLHLRFDRNAERNQEILSERLTPDEIVSVEASDSKRLNSLKKKCDRLILNDHDLKSCQHIFRCGAGANSFTISADGKFRVCSSLWHPDCIFDLNTGSLAEAWNHFVPQVLASTSSNLHFLEKCHACPIFSLCMCCPAHAYLESGRLDHWDEYFCQVAHARADALQRQKK